MQTPAGANALTTFRQNYGYETEEIAEKVGCSINTIYRLERGEKVRRTVAARYLRIFGINLNEPVTIPAGLNIIDFADRVTVDFDQ